MRRLKISDFILQANKVHRNKYSYENVNYLGNRVKVKITCKTHGVFSQSPSNHLYNKQGCPICYGNKKLTTEDFIRKAKKIHGNKYGYNNTTYFGNHKIVNIFCSKHGNFKQRATRHLCGDGCPRCNGGIKLELDEFILKAKNIHGELYDYSKFKYINSKTNGVIICNKHGEFFKASNNHINQKQGCPKCSQERKNLTTEDFIRKAKEIHGNKYEYSKIIYVHNSKNVIIICSKHGEFLQKAKNHLSGRGCRKCKQSKGEKIIMKYLNENNINYETQKTFNKCRNILPLRFDFYIPIKNLLIEFDGDQHKKPNIFFGGQKGFNYRKNNDNIKNNFVVSNNIKLLRINYNDYRSNRINTILNNNINII